jgi:hypothetical protein
LKVGQPEILECADCLADLGMYYFSRACCRGRFLVSVPLLALRQAWMVRWKNRVSAEFYADIERATKQRWEKVNGKRAHEN